MRTPASWQSVLQRILKIPGERERLAKTTGLSEMTLTRWAKGTSQPQRSHVSHLVQAVHPQHREELLTALEEIYPDIQSWFKDTTPEHIPAPFFAQVLSLRTTITETMRFWRISELILQQALQQLDPNQLGMSITLAQCMPPVPAHSNKIISLRERVGRGTYPWAADLEHLAIFLGMESLGGYSAEVRHTVNVDDLRKDKLLPAYRTEFEVSAAAHPIMFGGRVAGCLTASSTQVAHFTQERQVLLAAFTDLLALAFNREDFYEHKLIELKFMPKPEFQRPIINTFRDRVSGILSTAAHQRIHIPTAEAEQMAWREIEEEMLHLLDEAYLH